MKDDCRFLKNGRCFKRDGRTRCNRSNESWFDSELYICEIDDVCEKSSIFGNRYFAITEEHLEKLKAGKVLYYVDEYGAFIVLKPESV